MNGIFSCFFLVLFSLLISCSNKVYYNKNVSNWKSLPQPDSSLLYYTVYLIGDAGDPELDAEEPTFKILRKQIESDSLSSIVFLGDNIYDFGLPDESAVGRNLSEKKIDAQLAIVNNYKGKVFFISGNHDWARMNEEGLKAVRRQEIYIEQKLNRGNTFVPNLGCPGPYKIAVHNNVIIIALDSQWWLHNHDKPYGSSSDCSAEDESDVIAQLQDFIVANKNKNIVVVAHHPLYSNGNHGGYYSIMDYIFPLRLVSSKLYLPLPILGALYPLHRKFGGTSQDIVSYKYQRYKKAILNVITDHRYLVYAAGHDHNLQFHRADSLLHIVSGSGSKISPIKKGGGASFAQHSQGFAKLKYFSNGETWVEYWTPAQNGNVAELSFSHKVYHKRSSVPDLSCGLSNIDYKDSTVTVSAAKNFKRSRVGKSILGEHYRREWITPVKVNVFDLKHENGGMIPYGKEGGKHLLSLKLRDADSQEYKLRSINKNRIKTLPVDYHNTSVADLANDHVAAQHPYGALVVAALAAKAGVLHTNPKLVIIPEDSCLGPYKQEFKNLLVFYEENAEKQHEGTASLGNAKNIVGTDKVIEELQQDHNTRIDAHAFARARLFDMLIGDWNRHERQYRWVEQQEKNRKLYVPLPEDRDQAFFQFNGLLPWLVSRKWAVRYYQDFDYKYKDIVGLNAMATSIDRRFLSSLSRSDWEAASKSLSDDLTDSEIDNALKLLPPEVYAFHGPDIAAMLKARRNELIEVAIKYYQMLARYVDVYGSEKTEIFSVQRISNHQTEVTVSNLDKNRVVEDTLYHRIFDNRITKEVRLYGLGGRDVFLVGGQVQKSIMVRIIGGAEKDSIIDKSTVRGFKKQTVIYDLDKGNFVAGTSETNKELSPDSKVYEITQDKFHYNSLSPQVRLSFNRDDGLIVGAGFLYKKYKFRSQPYSALHRVILHLASSTGCMRLDYDQETKKILPGIDFYTRVLAYLPYNYLNYFGYGNQSQIPSNNYELGVNGVKINHFFLNPSLTKAVTQFFTIGIGPKYAYYHLQRNASYVVPLPALDLQPQHYLGIRAYFNIGAVDNTSNPSRGLVLTAEANWNKKIQASNKYSQYLSEFKFYITPNLPFQLTFAGRVGAGANTGTYQFYQANALGSGMATYGEQNLRGFRKTRFIGDQSFYQNLEVRAEVVKLNIYLFPGKIGVLALSDNGRVWARGFQSKQWHFVNGFGLWINIFDKIIFTGTYALSNEDKLVNFHLGFAF